MANPEHVEILKQGVEAWNQWREDNPDVEPDLSGTKDEPFVFAAVFKDTGVWVKWGFLYRPPAGADDDHGVLLSNANLSGADLWDADLSDANLNLADLSGANLNRAKLSGAELNRADLSGATLQSAKLSGAKLRGADLSGAKLGGADLSRAYLYDADLSGAELETAALNEAILVGATLLNADFFRADVTDAEFTRVIWKPGKRFRHAPGQGISSVRNNPGLQRYWSDELFIDAERAQLGESPVLFEWGVGFWKVEWKKLFAIHRPLKKPEWVILALLGALIATIASAPAPGGELLGHITSPAAWIPAAIGAGVGALLGLFFCAYWGRALVFGLWGLFDCGRSWPAVAGLAGVLITAFGFAYSLWLVPGGHMEWNAEDPGAAHWFYPWFVAAMGFATLGIADVAKPVTGLGQLMMMANVLAGFTTFGLLLSVLGNTFARRAG